MPFFFVAAVSASARAELSPSRPEQRLPSIEVSGTMTREARLSEVTASLELVESQLAAARAAAKAKGKAFHELKQPQTDIRFIWQEEAGRDPARRKLLLKLAKLDLKQIVRRIEALRA